MFTPQQTAKMRMMFAAMFVMVFAMMFTIISSVVSKMAPECPEPRQKRRERECYHVPAGECKRISTAEREIPQPRRTGGYSAISPTRATYAANPPTSAASPPDHPPGAGKIAFTWPVPELGKYSVMISARPR